MHLTLFQWLLPITLLLLECAALFILTKRGLRSSFPFFFNYLLFNIAGFFILAVTVQGAATTYFYAFWGVTAGTMLLAFTVLYEVFVNALKPYSAVIDLAKMLFAWAGVFLLVTAILTAFVTNDHQAQGICSAVLLLERSVQLMQCGMLLLLVVFQTRFGLSWRSPGMAIALALGLSASIGLIASYLESQMPAWAGRMDTLDSVCRIAILASLLVALMLRQPERKNVNDSPSRLIFQRWNEALMSTPFAARSAVAVDSSFLPNVEKTVDRVLARKIVH